MCTPTAGPACMRRRNLPIVTPLPSSDSVQSNDVTVVRRRRFEPRLMMMNLDLLDRGLVDRRASLHKLNLDIWRHGE